MKRAFSYFSGHSPCWTVVCGFSFWTTLDLRQERTWLMCPSGCQSACVEPLAMYSHTNAGHCCCLLLFNVPAPCLQVRQILLFRAISVLLICFWITILKRFYLPKSTSEHFFMCLNSFSVSQMILFPGTLGRLSLRREELFIHSTILGHSFLWRPARPKRLSCKHEPNLLDLLSNISDSPQYLQDLN